MDYSDLTWMQLRKLGTDNDMKVYGKGREQIEGELAAAGIAPKVAGKANTSWKPARMLDLEGQNPGFRYRWCDVDPANIRKKIAEGWVFVNRSDGSPVKHDDPNLIHGGATPDGVLQYRDVVAMAVPEETAQARDAYYRDINERQLAQVNENADSNLEKVGPMAKTRKGNLEITRIN